jgi:UDP-N-acetylmuramoylalanine--D-glutamate ligase
VAEARLVTESLAGRKVLILGLGVIGGGVAVALYFAAQGAKLRITDLRSAELLAPALSALRERGVDAEFVLGEHREEDIEWADVVLRNPGVPPTSPYLSLARQLGKPVWMELGYFAEHCPAPISAVTGTKGKTTTTSLLHQLLEADGSHVHLAGNMGVPAISLLDELTASDHVLLEVSAQQLEALAGWPVQVAVITNVDDDHLDRYGSLPAYRSVKASLALGPGADDWTVLPAWDLELAELCAKAPSRKVFVHDPDRPFAVADLEHAAVVSLSADGVVWTGTDGRAVPLCGFDGFSLLGKHNRVNLAYAAAAAYLNGRPAELIARTLPELRGVQHRLEPIGTVDGVTYVNDTAATAPIAVASALEALSSQGTPVLICGGVAKGSDFTPMLDAIEKAQAALVFLPGTGTDQLLAALRARGYPRTMREATSMIEAVAFARELAASERASHVLLSPGCASFGLFVNEFDRGNQFAAAVNALGGDELPPR